MSNKQPKALCLAGALEGGDTYESHSRPVYGWECRSGDPCQDSADELRRLHALNAELLAALKSGLEYISDFEDVIDSSDGIPQANIAMRIANSMRATIAKAEAAQ